MITTLLTIIIIGGFIIAIVYTIIQYSQLKVKFNSGEIDEEEYKKRKQELDTYRKRHHYNWDNNNGGSIDPADYAGINPVNEASTNPYLSQDLTPNFFGDND